MGRRSSYLGDFNDFGLPLAGKKVSGTRYRETGGARGGENGVHQ